MKKKKILSETDPKDCFEPHPDDIRLGYECEVLPKMYISEQTWTKKVCKNKDDVNTVLEMLKEKRVRCVYLSIADLILEGWELVKNKDDDFYSFQNRNINLDFRRSSHRIILGNGLYTGECRDINTLRQIIRWQKLN